MPPLTDDALHLIAARFRVLGEPLRLRLLHRLHSGECSVTDLAVQLGTTQPNVSKHLKVLQTAGVVARRQHKNTAFYSITDESVFVLCDVVCGKLRDRLEAQAQALPARPVLRGRRVTARA